MRKCTVVGLGLLLSVIAVACAGKDAATPPATRPGTSPSTQAEAAVLSAIEGAVRECGGKMPEARSGLDVRIVAATEAIAPTPGTQTGQPKDILVLPVTIINNSGLVIRTSLAHEWYGGEWPPTNLYACVVPKDNQEVRARPLELSPVYRAGERGSVPVGTILEPGQRIQVKLRMDWPGTGSVHGRGPLLSADKLGRHGVRFFLVFEAKGEWQFVESPVLDVTVKATPASVLTSQVTGSNASSGDAIGEGKFILTGRVTFADDGKPATKVNVELDSFDPDVGTTFEDFTKTDDRGWYSLRSPFSHVAGITVNHWPAEGSVVSLKPGRNRIDYVLRAKEGNMRATIATQPATMPATQPATAPAPAGSPATQAEVDPKTTVLAKGQPLDEAIELLRLAGAKDITDEINIRSREDFPNRWYELADRACLELIASRNNPERRWRVADVKVGPRGKRPANTNEWTYELARGSRWALNVADAKFDARQLRKAATQADTVFVGKVVKADLKETFGSGFMMSFREATYEVTRKLKGSPAGQITVSYLILGDGEYGDYMYLNDRRPQLNPKVFTQGAEHLVCAGLMLSRVVVVAPGEVRREHGPDDKLVVLYMTPHATDAEPVVRPVLTPPGSPATQAENLGTP